MGNLIARQGRKQNAKILTHIRGRLLMKQYVTLQLRVVVFFCFVFCFVFLFKIGTTIKGKNLLPEGANSFF